MRPAITDYLNALDRDIDGLPIISGYDLANRIIETEPVGSVQHTLASEFIAFSATIDVGDDSNPFLAENDEYATREQQLIQAISKL